MPDILSPAMPTPPAPPAGPQTAASDLSGVQVPPAAPAGLSASLAPVNVPSAAAPAGPSPDDASKHLVGKAFGHILSGLSGTEQSYSIDPQTGKQVVTTSKAPPGQWARGILAAGLLGDQNIGPAHGQHNFAQGLLAGLSGGTAAAKQLSDEDQAKKKAQAEQDYVNGLKAQENQRQDKELNLRDTLNKAQVAHENIQTAVQSQILHEAFQKEEGTASTLLVEGAKDRLQDYVDAGEKPVQEGLTSDQLQAMLKSDPGSSSKYIALPSGQKVSYDGLDEVATGEKLVNGHIETTYSLYTPLTKVPDTLVSRMKDAGLDTSAPSMYNKMVQAAKNGTQLDYREIAVAQREVGKQVGFQDILDKHRVALANIARDNASAAKDYIEANEAKYKFGKERSLDNGQQVYNSHFNPQNGDVDTTGLESTPAEFIKNWQNSHKDKDGNPSTQVPPKSVIDAGLLKAKQDRSDLNGYLDGMQQFYGTELIKYGKPTKNEDGTYSYTDPYAASIAQIQGNVVRGIQALHGITTPKPPPDIKQDALAKYTQGLAPGAVVSMGIITNKFPSGDSLYDALKFAATIPIGQGFSPEDKKALIDRLPQYYNDLQTSTESNSQKNSEQNRQVQNQVNNILREQQSKNLVDQGAGITASD